MNDRAQCGRCGAAVEVGALFCAKCGLDVTVVEEGDATVAMSPDDASSAVGPLRSTTRQMLREATLGEYEILDELGRGGMATVFRAHDISLDRKVAIKVMAPHLLEGEGMAERFKLEARTAAQLSHPHIIPIYAVRESASTLFFVMKYVEGRALDEIVAKMGPLPIPMVKDILTKVGSALGYAHRRDVVHRDVKPGNIMIDDEGTPIVTDFGIAKVAETTGLTMTGAAIGTPSYMSPEQCEAKTVTGSSDQYSLGIVAFQMLTGKLPYEGDSAVTVMYKHCHEELPPLVDFRPDCPVEVLETVERMVEKDPADRWPSLEAAIQKLATDGSSQSELDPIRSELVKAAREGDLELLQRLSTPGASLPGVRAGTPQPTPAPAAPAPTRRSGMVAVAAAVLGLALAGSMAVLRPWGGSAESGARADAIDAPGPGSSGEAGSATSTPNGGVPPVDGGASREPGSAGEPPAGGEGSTPSIADAGARAEPPALGRDGEREASGGASPLRVSSVRIGGLPGGLEPGDRASLTATAIGPGGAPIPADAVEACESHGWSRCGFDWTSSDPGVVSVDAAGLLRALAPGGAEISVTAAGTVGRARVEVRAAAPASVSITPASVALPAGEGTRLSARVSARSGDVIENVTVGWRSSDPGVVSVSAAGDVLARTPGPATVTATVGGVSGTAAITVEAAPVATAAAVAQLVAGYAAGLEAGDVDAVRRVYPDLPAEQRAAVEDLGELRNLAVILRIDAIDDEGDSATADVSGTYTFDDRAAGSQRLDVAFVARFARDADGGWIITDWTPR